MNCANYSTLSNVWNGSGLLPGTPELLCVNPYLTDYQCAQPPYSDVNCSRLEASGRVNNYRCCKGLVGRPLHFMREDPVDSNWGNAWC